jgi:alcohol dehydrogenase (NADP+)
MSQSGLPEHILSVFRYDSENDVFFQKSVQRELRAHEVLIRTTHASLCYTDVHAKHRGIGLGHEGVGIVERVGEAVKSLHVGQRAGWGYEKTSISYNGTVT